MKNDSVDAFVPIPIRWCYSGYLLTNRRVNNQRKIGQLVAQFGIHLEEVCRLAKELKNLSKSAKKGKLDWRSHISQFILAGLIRLAIGLIFARRRFKVYKG